MFDFDPKTRTRIPCEESGLSCTAVKLALENVFECLPQNAAAAAGIYAGRVHPGSRVFCLACTHFAPRVAALFEQDFCFWLLTTFQPSTTSPSVHAHYRALESFSANMRILAVAFGPRAFFFFRR